jgi:hypothetical protein
MTKERLDCFIELERQHRHENLREALRGGARSVDDATRLARDKFERLSKMLQLVPDDKRKAILVTFIDEVMTVANSYITLAHKLAYEQNWREARQTVRTNGDFDPLWTLMRDAIEHQWGPLQ